MKKLSEDLMVRLAISFVNSTVHGRNRESLKLLSNHYYDGGLYRVFVTISQLDQRLLRKLITGMKLLHKGVDNDDWMIIIRPVNDSFFEIKCIFEVNPKYWHYAIQAHDDVNANPSAVNDILNFKEMQTYKRLHHCLSLDHDRIIDMGVINLKRVDRIVNNIHKCLGQYKSIVIRHDTKNRLLFLIEFKKKIVHNYTCLSKICKLICNF